MIAETYVIEAQQATDPPTQQQAYANAITAYQAELALSPVTPQSTALTARHKRTIRKCTGSWRRSTQATGQNSLAKNELQSYLQATQWHSDVYPWRIALARKPNPNVGASEIVFAPAERSRGDHSVELFSERPTATVCQRALRRLFLLNGSERPAGLDAGRTSGGKQAERKHRRGLGQLAARHDSPNRARARALSRSRKSPTKPARQATF